MQCKKGGQRMPMGRLVESRFECVQCNVTLQQRLFFGVSFIGQSKYSQRVILLHSSLYFRDLSGTDFRFYPTSHSLNFVNKFCCLAVF